MKGKPGNPGIEDILLWERKEIRKLEIYGDQPWNKLCEEQIEKESGISLL